MFPTGAKLLNRARERLVRLAQKLGVRLRQSYRRVGKLALIKHQRYAHAHQFKRANRSFSHVSARPKAYKQNAEAMDAFKKTSPSMWRKSVRNSHSTQP